MGSKALGAMAAFTVAVTVHTPAALALEWRPPYELIPGSASAGPVFIASNGETSPLLVYDTFRDGASWGPEARTRLAGGWSPVERLRVSRNENVVTDLGVPQMSDGGSALITWELNGDAERSDWVIVYRPDRGFGPLQRVVDAPARHRFRPFATTDMGPGGHGAALYFDGRGMSVRTLAPGAMRFGAPIRLSAPAGALDGLRRKLVVARRGVVAAAWPAGRGHRCHLQVATAPTLRGPWTARELSAPYACFSTPGLAMNPAGRAVVAWRARVGGVFAATGSASGGFGRPQRLSDGGARIRLAMDGGGRATVAFVQRAGEGRRLLVATAPSGGRFGPPAELARGDIGPGLPEIRANRAGDVAVHWRAGIRDWIATRARGAGSFTAPDVLAKRTSGFHPTQFFLDQNGFVLASWLEPDRRRIRAALWRAGSRVGTRSVLGPSACPQSPRLAHSRAGHVLIGWIGDCGFDSEPASMWAAVRGPGGPIGPAQAVSDPAPLLACWPELAIDSAGRGIAAWCGEHDQILAAELIP